MYFAGKNLLYIFNQTLDTGFVTMAVFKRYARSPENRTYKNYFRPSKLLVSYAPKGLFTTYMRKRPHCALSRYTAMHRRRKNPILTHFVKQTTNTIMEKLQHLRQRTIPSSLKPQASSLFLQNKPISKNSQIAVSDLPKTGYCSRVTDNCQNNKAIQSQSTRTPAFPVNILDTT